jgi:uncharacterized protein (TIGR03118 family)
MAGRSARYGCFTAALAALIAGASGGGGGGSPATPAAVTPAGLSNVALVSDGVVAAAHADAKLQNPWGIAFAPGGAFWIADNNDNLSTLYDGNGVAESLVVTIPAGAAGPANPSGQVYNATPDFVMGTGNGATPALFLFDGEGGTITGWASGTAASILYDDGAVNGAQAAVYKGLALANNGSANFLYATDLHNAKVDVFDGQFNKVSAAGGAFAGKFTDPNMPAGYAPFGITLVDGALLVTYARQNAAANDEVLGAGMGYIDSFDLNGNLLRRFASGGTLNAPWGMALAPAGFGTVGGQLLVGNFGDGAVHGYNLSSGADEGAVTLAGGQALVIPGLWALVFGNGALNAPNDALYYTAGPSNQQDGVFGRIQFAKAMTSSSSGGY